MNKTNTILFGLLLTVSATFLFSSGSAQALDGNDFKPGRIMDDEVFFNGQSIDASEVQTFLNSKVFACDTDGTLPYAGTTAAAYGTSRGYPPPYICLKDYVQTVPEKTAEPGLCNGITAGDKTAAQIIAEVGASCGVNPQVLLVLLQKEQSLVTDTWPWPIQYRSATGYGCPDSAPCDAEYSGFFNQVYNAARQFKRYARDTILFSFRAFRDSYIQYHPNFACGGSNVFIVNQATAGLYNYTPYQPNAASLANLYGVGDGCSSYGNRNFWRLFNEWFGSTLYEPPMIIPAASITANGAEVLTVDYGASVTIKWESRHVDTCIVQPLNTSAVSGQSTIPNLTATAIYRINCSGPNGNAGDNVTITVRPLSFTSVKSLITNLSPAPKGQIKEMTELAETAERQYNRGNVKQAKKTLESVIETTQKLAKNGKITQPQADGLIKTIQALIATWQ